jgi:hypothetical protein
MRRPVYSEQHASGISFKRGGKLFVTVQGFDSDQRLARQ